jgi:16S rRNA (adenine1518-N6/adenine1519-N6)-dimethyltransferase
MARQRLGQHFLADEGWQEKIARAIRVSPHGMQRAPLADQLPFCWVEIGAGHGEMTEHLLRSGAPVIAVELDGKLLPGLQELAAQHPNLTIFPGDVLETDLRKLAAGRRLKIYGNLPYYITSPIMQHCFSYADIIDEINIVLQLEVAERLAAEPGTKPYGYLSVTTQFYARPEIELLLPPGAFRPPPEVDSALVTMQLPGAGAKLNLSDTDAFLEFVKICFSQKRKTLPNNLKGLLPPSRCREILRQLNLREDARAEQLSVAELAALYQAISSEKPAAGPGSRT